MSDESVDKEIRAIREDTRARRLGALAAVLIFGASLGISMWIAFAVGRHLPFSLMVGGAYLAHRAYGAISGHRTI